MLTAKRVERTKTPGRYRDGLVKGLLLQVSESGAKSWVLRYELHGSEHMMGLGSAADFSLKEARERARAARQQLADGLDPLVTKHAARATAKALAAKALTFRGASERYFEQHQSKWRNPSHRDQFLSSLRTYATPILDMDVAQIGLPDVLRCIEPIWTTKAITADRVRNRIESVLDWCVVRGHRSAGTNPARWRGHLDQVLPAARDVAPIVHHPALDYHAIPAFMASLRERNSVASRALEFLILTAARTAEVTGARWSEINFDDAVWVVPPERMKTHREHRIALAPQPINLLRNLPVEGDNDGFVFIGATAGGHLSKMAMTYALKPIRDDVTIHGFRSAFSDWAHEQTAHSNHTIEISLSHNVGSKVEQAYRRKDMLAKRTRLMVDWAKYCTTKPVGAAGNVTSIHAQGRR